MQNWQQSIINKKYIKKELKPFNAQSKKIQTMNTQFFLVYTKDKYYEDIDTRIKLYDNYLDKLSKSLFKSVADKRISELKEEQFLKQGKVKEN